MPKPKRRAEDQAWYIQRGIPVIPILTFVLALVAQSVVGVRYVTGLEAKIASFETGFSRIELRVDRVETKVDVLNAKFESSLVPAAVNTRRIEDLERRIDYLERIRR